MRWATLDPEAARAHPRFGLGGWLYVFFAFVCFAIVADAVEWFSHGPGSDRPAWLLGVGIVANLVVLVAGMRRWRWFPELAMVVIWVTGAMGQTFSQHAQVAAGTPTELDARTFGIAGYLMFSALLTWLLLVSERVNVTYKHRVRPTSVNGA
ncbi:MAG: hypothetical protein AAFX81_21155 [Pseudomonadota bacterium]